jgi:hypothetical protein
VPVPGWEINHLVTDFNEMAEKLQTLDIQRKSGMLRLRMN